MADNQEVKIRATADTARIEGKLDKLATQLDFVAAKSRKVGGDSKKAGTDASGAFGGLSKSVNGAVNSMMAMAGPAALIAGLIASVQKLITYYKELEKVQASATNTAGQTLSSVAFGTGLINDPGGLARLQEKMKTNASLISPKEEYQIFNIVSSEDVRNKRTFDEEIALSSRIADTIPKFLADQGEREKFSKDAGVVFGTGAFTEDEALARGLFFSQGKGRNSDAIQSVAKSLTAATGANLSDAEMKQFVDSALAMSGVAAANNLRGTSASGTISSLISKEVNDIKTSGKAAGLTEQEIDAKIAAGTEERSRRAVDTVIQAVAGDKNALARLEQSSTQGVELAAVLRGGAGAQMMREMQAVNYDESIAKFMSELTPEASIAMQSSTNRGDILTGRSFSTRSSIREELKAQNTEAIESEGGMVNMFNDWYANTGFGRGIYLANEKIPGAGTFEEQELRRLARTRGTTPEEEFNRIFPNVNFNEQFQESFPNIDINLTITTDENTNVIQAD